jgi:hypothetical protein
MLALSGIAVMEEVTPVRFGWFPGPEGPLSAGRGLGVGLVVLLAGVLGLLVSFAFVGVAAASCVWAVLQERPHRSGRLDSSKAGGE